MLALDRLGPSLSPLRLLLGPHGLGLDTHDDGPADKQPVVQVATPALGPVRHKVHGGDAVVANGSRRLGARHDEAGAAEEAAGRGIHDGRAADRGRPRRGFPGSGLECEVSGSKGAGFVQAQDIARLHAVHQERQAQRVARRDEIRAVVDVCGDVVWALGAEGGQQFLDRVANGRARLSG